MKKIFTKHLEMPKFIVVILRVVLIVSIAISLSITITYFKGGRDFDKAHIFGFRTYHTTGDSMEPNLIGEKVLVKVVNPKKLKIGDVIAYNKKISSTNETMGIVHRIIDKRNGGFVVKGDNVEIYDSWIVYPDEVLGVVKYEFRGLKPVKVESKVYEHNFNLDDYFNETVEFLIITETGERVTFSPLD